MVKESRARRALEVVCPCARCFAGAGDYVASRCDLLQCHSLSFFKTEFIA